MAKLRAIKVNDWEQYISKHKGYRMCEKCGQRPYQFRYAYYYVEFLCGLCFFELQINETVLRFHRQR